MSIYEWASKGESWYGINSPSWLRLMSSILLPLTWKKTDLQILCFPFMGNFTSSSWGLVQMKTNGEADSSQVSGNCRGREDQQRKDQFSIILHRRSPAILHVLNLMMPSITVMKHSESVCVYIAGEMSPMPDVIQQLIESHWVFCSIITWLMTQLLMTCRFTIWEL